MQNLFSGALTRLSLQQKGYSYFHGYSYFQRLLMYSRYAFVSRVFDAQYERYAADQVLCGDPMKTTISVYFEANAS